MFINIKRNSNETERTIIKGIQTNSVTTLKEVTELKEILNTWRVIG
jgi:hypothetical protein